MTNIDITTMGLELPVVESVVAIPELTMLSSPYYSYIVCDPDGFVNGGRPYGVVFPNCPFAQKDYKDNCGDFHCHHHTMAGGLHHDIFPHFCGCSDTDRCPIHMPGKHRRCGEVVEFNG
jgi:hypothetical protein